VLKRVCLNAYVIDLPLDFVISLIFNNEDLIAYKRPHLIPNDHFEMLPNLTHDNPIKTSTPFTMTLTQKDNIDAILDEQVICTMDGEIQWFLVRWMGRLNLDCTWITRDTLQ
jgi:hypothetical protein